MYPYGPYSRGLMTRISLGLGPPVYHLSHTDPAPGWEEQVCGPLIFAEPPTVLSEVIYRHDREPVGWLPPRYPSPPLSADWSSLSIPIPKTADPLELNTSTNDEDPDTPQDSADTTSSDCNGSAVASSTPATSMSAGSPSSSAPSRDSSVGPTRGAQDSSPDASLLQALRGKERERIRRSSGVNPKPKSRFHGLRSGWTATGSKIALEMVECQWTGCLKRMHVDYVDVKHWGQHVREHYADQQEMVECKWDGGCGAVISKSSMWKHIVVHQPKFKIRCPRGCGVFTRGDMMKRHLQSCALTATAEEKSGEEDSHVDDYDGDGKGEGVGKEC